MLYEDFVTCFDGVDSLILAPVYSAREKPIDGYDSLKLLNGVKERVNAELIETYEEIVLKLKEEVVEGDVVMILGAGTIDKLCDLIWKKGVMFHITPFFIGIYMGFDC